MRLVRSSLDLTRSHVTTTVISLQSREKMSADGSCQTHFRWDVHETFTLMSPFLALSSLQSCSRPCWCRLSRYLSSERTSLWVLTRFGVPNSIVSNTLFYFMVVALIPLLALLCTHVWHTVPLISILCENAIKAISLSLGYVLSELECVVSSPCYCLHV